MKRDRMLKKIQIYRLLHKNNFMYKNKTITPRTVRTMFETGFFDTIQYSEFGNCWLVAESEILNKIQEQKEEQSNDL